MRRLGTTALRAALLASLLEAPPLRAQPFVLDDGDFTPGTWESSFAHPAGASATALVAASGGNPGAYFHVRHDHRWLSGGGIYLISSRHLYTGLLSPSLDGPIGRLRFTFQKRRWDPSPAPGFDSGASFYPTIQQGNRTFVATNPNCQGAVGEWGLYERYWDVFRRDCAAADFDDLDEPGVQNPDFSLFGGEMRVGFTLVTQSQGPSPGSTRTVIAGLDSFRVDINPEALPPQTTVPGLSIAVEDNGVNWAESGWVRYDMTLTNEQGVPGPFIVQSIVNAQLSSYEGSAEYYDNDEYTCLGGGQENCASNPFEIPAVAPGLSLSLALQPRGCIPGDTSNLVCHTWDHTLFFTANLLRFNPGGYRVVARACAATPGRPCYVDGRPCCLAEALGAAFPCPTIQTTNRSPNAQTVASADDNVDGTLLYQLRDVVFHGTSGGRRATELYYEWSDDVVRTAIFHPSLFGLAKDALLAWQPHLLALVEGRGGEAVVTAEQMALLNTFLGALKQEAPEPLREAIEREESNWDLSSWTGLPIEQALSRMNRFSCEESEYVLCVNGGRFRVETTWQKSQGEVGAGHAVRLTDDTGYFWFFDPDNVEEVVKVLDGCGVNGRFWAFGAGLTNVDVRTELTDTLTGESKVYLNAQGSAFEPFQDTALSQGCGASLASSLSPGDFAWSRAGPAQPIAASGSQACTPSETALCLREGRFRVEADWETAQGARGNARASPLTADTGTFWFFDPQNVEMVVKVLPGCGVNQRQWVFAGGLTNVRVDWRVTDTQTGEVRTYANPLGSAFRPVQDTSAFATCP